VPPGGSVGSFESCCLRRPSFELLHISCGGAGDGYPPRLHGLRNLPEQFDRQQTVVEAGALHLHIVGKAELAPEVSRGNPSVKKFAARIRGLAAFDRDHIVLGGDGNFLRREAGNRKRNLVAVFVEPFDVVGRVVVLASALGHFGKVKKAVETDGRTPQGREVVSAHSQILQRARWV